jgi:hypothetical protein
LSRIYERRRSFAVVFVAVLAAVVGLTMASMSTAWADGSSKCDRAAFADDTGYLACLYGSGSSSGSGSGSVNASDDLPVTGSNPMKTIVIGSAFIVVGAAAVAGSLQTRRRSRASY